METYTVYEYNNIKSIILWKMNLNSRWEEKYNKKKSLTNINLYIYTNVFRELNKTKQNKTCNIYI